MSDEQIVTPQPHRKDLPKLPTGFKWATHFGISWVTPVDQEITVLQAAGWCFRYWERAAQMVPELAKIEKQDWFWYLVNYLWPKGGAKHFVRHPWADEMAYDACRWQFYALSGCASSGKTDFGAVWALVNWAIDPLETKCLVTSTSLKEARGRIWGSIVEYFQASPVLGQIGKLIDSEGKIRTEAYGYKTSPKQGIELVACERSQEKEAVKKLIGIKQRNVIVIADELPELPESILSAVYGNLAPGILAIPGGSFQMLGLGNFKSVADCFGVFSEPLEGWSKVSVETGSWNTKRGFCRRFDGLKSPNFNQNKDIWPIYGRHSLKEHEELGRNTAQFWRMCRSFPAPEGVADTVYSDAELIAGDVFGGTTWGTKSPVLLAALDPAFTSDGDDAKIVVGKLGANADGLMVLQVVDVATLKEDVTKKGMPFDKQIAVQFKDECLRRGIQTSHAAYDATGSGISFGTLLGEVWETGLLGVKFGGSASEAYVPGGDVMKQAKEVYANRVTELWFVAKPYMRAGQIKGVTRQMAQEMTARKYETKKGKETQVVVEPKRDMKARVKRSPDESDAFFILLELARARFGFTPKGMGVPSSSVSENWVDRYDQVYDVEAIVVE